MKKKMGGLEKIINDLKMRIARTYNRNRKLVEWSISSRLDKN